MSIPEFENSMPPIRHDGWDTNFAAAERMFPRTGQNKYRLVEAHISAGERGLIDHEAAKALGPKVAWSTAGATRHALNKGRDHGIAWFEPTAARRNNENDNSCVVWQLTAEARELLGLGW